MALDLGLKNNLYIRFSSFPALVSWTYGTQLACLFRHLLGKTVKLTLQKKPAEEHVDVIQTVFGAPGGEHQYYDPELKME